MSIQTELTRITNAKAAIKTAIEGKGVTVPEATLLDGMAALIAGIEAGGDFVVETGTITFAESYIPSSTPLSINHSLGKTPFAFIAYNGAPGYSPKNQIAFLYKLEKDKSSSYGMRSKLSTMTYSQKSGTDALYAYSSLDLITLSSSKITISGGPSTADFNPDTSGNHPATLVWYAIAYK